MIETFRLIRPLGMQDVNFEKYAVDQQDGRIAFWPDKGMGIRGLYPDNEKGEYRIEYDDGRFDVFNSQGEIIRSETTPSVCQKYSYDKSGRLETVALIQQKKTVMSVKLSYDKQGRISLAETSGGKIRYGYDSKGDLIQVATEKSTIEYTYNDRHLVTSVRINGNPSAAFEYDEFGRVLAQKDPKDNLLRTEIKTIDGKTEITEGAGDQKITRIYDSGGRLLEARISFGS